MTKNTFSTQLELIEYNLRLLENHHIDLNDKNTLDTLLPYFVKQVSNTEILFFNKNGEVIIDFLNDFLYIECFNEMIDKNFYRKSKNFEYIFIEYKMSEDIIYFYDKKLSKKVIAKYIQKVRDFLDLLSK
ncbi:hypothetical protein ACOL3J_04925 [Aliarcobacter butzleri]|uniref:hypothetical protein n=1 Tax=Aliarcobacter cryaerophilus TaxID=28198 RepID=UPI00164C2693|nr:hypothetical protein [Aliarcobacter cryaerophilus]QNK85599.1 hypothetical protein HOO31_03050 [Aliarcobacter cryaerophilus]